MDDPLLKWRPEFPALESCVHLISHSLGCMPLRAAEYLNGFLEHWHEKSISAWNDWLPEVDHAAARVGRLLSAPTGTVIMQTNVSQCMAVLASCLEYTPKRNKVVYEDIQFPTVSYVWKAEERRGARVELVVSKDGNTIDTEALCAAIDEQTIAVPISHVVYKSAYIQDVKAVVQRAREVGAHVILDCYQSIGTIPIDVVEMGVSFACGGSVKYLCGGPGAGWLYVREDLIQQFSPRVTGWFGNEHPFAFTMPEQTYADNIWRFMQGTPAIAALYQARAGIDIIAEVGVRNIREKSLRQTRRIIELVDERKFKLNSPREDAKRGGSVVFDFPEAASVARELNARRFYCDHRPGAGIRIAPHLYTKDEEINLFFDEVEVILRGGASA
jgi:kynureninase